MPTQIIIPISPNSAGISFANPTNKKVCRLVYDDQAAPISSEAPILISL
jgi:hypothetical protein